LTQTFAQTNPEPTYGVGVRWNPNPEPDISHYVVSYYEKNIPLNIKSFSAPKTVDPVSGKVRFSLDGLKYDVEYHFFVVAVNLDLLVSDRSDEVIYTRPRPMIKPTAPTGLIKEP
jgi:hypothetical protein